MSGRTSFSYGRWLVLCDYVWDRMGVQHHSAEGLAWHMMHIDFGAYRKLGKSITGATYLRGVHYPEVREVGIGWFRGYVRARTGRSALVAGWAGTVYALWKAL